MKKIIFIFLSIILVYSYYSNRNTIQEIETINTKLASNDTRVNNNINMDNFKNMVYFNYLDEVDWGKRILAKLTHDLEADDS